jgi:hypothetical protein
MNVIRTRDLKKIFNRIVDKLEHENIQEIEIPTDLYRFIPTDEWHKFDNDVIEVGSLKDDIESLLLIATDLDRPCTYVDFDRMAGVLRSISQTINPPG